MTELSGFVLKTLWDNGEFVLSRGRRPGDAIPILVLALARHSAENLRRLEHEYSFAAELDPAWAVRPLTLHREGERIHLILEDPGGDPLQGMLGHPFELTRFLTIAVAMAAALDQVHQHGFIHKDIKPANMLVRAAGEVRLTGFGIASRLPREHQPPTPPEAIAGTLAYMAPEQTGRMNRSIDARSDLYALGVAFYEMLTGALPFAASEEMEWIHCHIARQPMRPDERVNSIPAPVADVVCRLLAKNAEDRYQTAVGVAADLRRCLAAWQTHRRIDPFGLGADDVPDRLLIPEKLYGREGEIGILVAAFGRILGHGGTELVLVSGYSGIGKSSIVNDLHKVLVPPRGLFAAGKFEQYKRDIPYATLAQAFQTLIRQILSKDDAELDRWRSALLRALGPNGHLMVTLIPELSLVIGEQPPVPDLPPRDAQNRFQMVFRQFLGVFARPEHPLVLFLDDLQWLDTATAELLQRLVLDSEVRHVLLIGAYRDNEVSPRHPLMRSLEALRAAGDRVHEIVLTPLTAEDVEQLVAGALRTEAVRVRPLAALVFDKTGGNPFFVIQFVSALAEEGLLARQRDRKGWRWDLDRIRAKGMTDNVVHLMVGKLNQFSNLALDILRQLACLGISSQADKLSAVVGLSEAEIHGALWDVVRAGLVFRREGAYAFLHDRVQEAAYALIPEAERAAVHLRIGRALASRAATAERDDEIFEIVNQLNRAAALIDTPDERAQAAAFNLLAGERAKTAMANASALRYLVAGCALLPDDHWEHHFRLTFDLELRRAECEFLTGDLAAAEERLSSLSDRAAGLVDQAAVTRLRLAPLHHARSL